MVRAAVSASAVGLTTNAAASSQTSYARPRRGNLTPAKNIKPGDDDSLSSSLASFTSQEVCTAAEPGRLTMARFHCCCDVVDVFKLNS